MEQLFQKKQQLREAIEAATNRLEQLKTTRWNSDVQLGKLTLKVSSKDICLSRAHCNLLPSDDKRASVQAPTYYEEDWSALRSYDESVFCLWSGTMCHVQWISIFVEFGLIAPNV